jgi:rare lipoprotein A
MGITGAPSGPSDATPETEEGGEVPARPARPQPGVAAAGQRPALMTRTPSRSRHRSSTRPEARPGRRRRTRLVGSVLAGLAVTSAALVVLPAGEAATPQAAPTVRAQAVTVSSALPAPVAVRATPPRASRGGARTALPPLRRVTRTVAVGDTFSGNASWYGGSFQGQRTANGERFDTDQLTAASKTLPFGTRLRVCRPARCVVVRINDRGPYVSGRVLDLSRAARDALGYDGVARVTATPVERRTVTVRSPARAAVKPAAAPPVRAAAPVPTAFHEPVQEPV